MKRKKKYTSPRHDSPQAFIARVRRSLPLAQELLLDGWDSDPCGLHTVIEKRLKDSGRWQKHDANNAGGSPDAICDMFLDAVDEGFVLGLAYGLQLNASTFLKVGGR
jgi:hypothetical protein